jgi:hypothetical protein
VLCGEVAGGAYGGCTQSACRAADRFNGLLNLPPTSRPLLVRILGAEENEALPHLEVKHELSRTAEIRRRASPNPLPLPSKIRIKQCRVDATLGLPAGRTMRGQRTRRFFSDYKDTISALAFIAGLIGLGVTISQIHNTNVTLQATNAYAIQKDARDLVSELQNDVAFREYVLENDPNKQYAASTVTEAKRDVGRLLNFYLSVYRQYKAGGISSLLAESFGKDFCGVMKNPIITGYWKANLETSPEHAELKHAWCP